MLAILAHNDSVTAPSPALTPSAGGRRLSFRGRGFVWPALSACGRAVTGKVTTMPLVVPSSDSCLSLDVTSPVTPLSDSGGGRRLKVRIGKPDGEEHLFVGTVNAGVVVRAIIPWPVRAEPLHVSYRQRTSQHGRVRWTTTKASCTTTFRSLMGPCLSRSNARFSSAAAKQHRKGRFGTAMRLLSTSARRRCTCAKSPTPSLCSRWPSVSKRGLRSGRSCAPL